MHKCLTCFREFTLEQANYRCVSTKCVEKDEKLSEFMLGVDQVLGTVITPEDAGGWKSSRSGGESQQLCHKCQNPTSIRICPHCHGELPTYLDGVPGHIVYVLGPKGCGKSLYLVATFEHLEKRVFPTRLNSHFEFCTRYTKERYKRLRDRVYRSGVLLDATRAGRVDPDLVLPFIFNANVKSYIPFLYPLSRSKAVNVAAFDTSGEDCEKLEALEWCCQGLPKSSALIVLIDPTSFPSIASQLPLEAKTSIVDQVGNPKTVIDNITQYYRSSNGLAAHEKVPIPTAFVVTKVDALKSLFDPASRIFEEAQHRKGYDRAYCEQVSKDMKSFLRDERIGGNNIVTAAENGFKDHLFFAVTSLGKPPRVEAGQKRADNISPRNPENPWLWILYRLGILSEV
jgi:hypothetical protein